MEKERKERRSATYVSIVSKMPPSLNEIANKRGSTWDSRATAAMSKEIAASAQQVAPDYKCRVDGRYAILFLPFYETLGSDPTNLFVKYAVDAINTSRGSLNPILPNDNAKWNVAFAVVPMLDADNPRLEMRVYDMDHAETAASFYVDAQRFQRIATENAKKKPTRKTKEKA